jgi:hypothetical protein
VGKLGDEPSAHESTLSIVPRSGDSRVGPKSDGMDEGGIA